MFQLGKRPRKFLAGVFGLSLIAIITVTQGVGTILAFDTSSTNYINGKYYNNLISDSAFINVNSMSTSAIQSFLNSKGGYLANAPSSQLGTGADGRKAAKIIYDAAHGHREASGTLNGIVINTSTGTINPMAIIVTLQKEQSLITRTDYSQNALDKAMGYGCPDGGSCSPTYKGFTNQVEWAAWQLRYNYEAAGKDVSWWNSHYSTHYYVGKTRSHGWSGTYYLVTYKNKATAGLYRYTPHVGFGNYNFWQLMINWFNVTPGSGGGVTPQTYNDTESIATTTYRTKVSVAGTKATGVTVYYGSTKIANSTATTWKVTISPIVGKKSYYIYYKNGSSTVAQKKITIDRRKVGDVNGDKKVDLLDVSHMSDAWGKTVKDEASINLNPDKDNIVDLLDLSLLANSFEG